MLCPRCGANNPAESAFCGGCGSVLAPSAGAAAALAVPNAPVQVEPVPITPSHPALSFQPEVLAPQDELTMSAEFNQAAPQESQTPQPVPSASEFFDFGGPISQDSPGPGAFPPSSPTPVFPDAAYQIPQQGFVSGAYPGQAPQQGFVSGAYPGQVPQQGFVSGAYPGQAPQQGFVSGAYPGQAPQQGFVSGAYPGQISGAEYPAGAYPAPGPGGSYPGFPGGAYQEAYPGQQFQPAWGAYPGGVPPKVPSKLINPLPRWAFITSIVVVTLILVALVFFTGSDWAAGAQTSGVVALVLGALLLVAFGVRSALGLLLQTNVHRRSQVISSLILIVLLFASATIGLTQQLDIHNVQGHSLEGQKNWQSAINEYELGGQGQPSSEDIARTYNEWGEQLLSQQQYNKALTQFTTVIENYDQTTDQVNQAQKDAVSTYQGWGNQAMQQQAYSNAAKHFDDLLNQSYCATACQSQTSADDAGAYYDLAEQQLAAQNYASSVAAFNQLTSRFTSSSHAQSAHADYAKALWGEGQQQLTSTCSDAVTTYKQLASQFSDTSQGRQATTALKQPQPVNGTFTSTIPSGSNIPMVSLVQGVTSTTSSDQFYAILNKSPLVNVNADGSFSFKPLAQGTYDLVWGVENQSDGQIEFFVGTQYPATVGPLCTFSFGNIDEKFPAP
jgi:tetratricopeptide (TPR) repeat protein